MVAKLALDLKIGENQLRDLMDWSEEIALRDGIAIAAIFAGKVIDDIATDPRLGRADKVKRIKESLRRLRFPRLAQTEDEIHDKIRALKLQPEIRVTVPPGLEGGRLQIEFSVTNAAGLQTAGREIGGGRRNEFHLRDLCTVGRYCEEPGASLVNGKINGKIFNPKK